MKITNAKHDGSRDEENKRKDILRKIIPLANQVILFCKYKKEVDNFKNLKDINELLNAFTKFPVAPSEDAIAKEVLSNYSTLVSRKKNETVETAFIQATDKKTVED
jgi:hypothetical protein